MAWIGFWTYKNTTETMAKLCIVSYLETINHCPKHIIVFLLTMNGKLYEAEIGDRSYHVVDCLQLNLAIDNLVKLANQKTLIWSSFLMLWFIGQKMLNIMRPKQMCSPTLSKAWGRKKMFFIFKFHKFYCQMSNWQEVYIWRGHQLYLRQWWHSSMMH